MLASTLDSTVTPTIAPKAPGMASWRTNRWSMLRKRQCATALATPVATFAMFTVVDDFQQWISRVAGRGAADAEADAMPSPGAVG